MDISDQRDYAEEADNRRMMEIEGVSEFLDELYHYYHIGTISRNYLDATIHDMQNNLPPTVTIVDFVELQLKYEGLLNSEISIGRAEIGQIPQTMSEWLDWVDSDSWRELLEPEDLHEMYQEFAFESPDDKSDKAFERWATRPGMGILHEPNN